MNVIVGPPISKVDVHNITLPAANEDILASPVEAEIPISYFNVSVCSNVAGILSIVYTIGADEIVTQLNGGQNIEPNVLYIWSIPVRMGDKINVRLNNTDGKMLILRIDEVTV